MFIIGITGLSCSGKTTLSENLQKTLGEDNCLLLSMDDYYKELSEDQYKILHDDEAAINFDCPDSIDFDLLLNHLTAIRENREIDIPKYDLGNCVVTKFFKVRPNQFKCIILEGVFIFCNEKLKELLNLKIWVETAEYICALRRFIKYSRDIKGYSPDFIYNQCIKHVIPGQEKYIKPYKSSCEIIFNGEQKDSSYIEMIVFLVNQKMKSF